MLKQRNHRRGAGRGRGVRDQVIVRARVDRRGLAARRSCFNSQANATDLSPSLDAPSRRSVLIVIGSTQLLIDH
ncbi:MAG: hypothetical protein R3C56_13060 [Pirellulaceae bacterium]